jgi:hypothetical protein
MQSTEHRKQGHRRSSAVKFNAAVLFWSALGMALGIAPTTAVAQDAAADVAYVESVGGRVVAFSLGKPALLEALDIIHDQTQLDVLAKSELRICHYQSHQLLTLTGPLKASISRNGVTVDNAKGTVVSAGPCVRPVASTFIAGILSRGLKITNVSPPDSRNSR